jgi:ABC-type multidrug transport system permease subunit
MERELGKWLMDVAKYVTTAVLITSFLGSFEQKWVMYVVGSVTIIVSMSIGLWLIVKKKNNKNKKED